MRKREGSVARGDDVRNRGKKRGVLSIVGEEGERASKRIRSRSRDIVARDELQCRVMTASVQRFRFQYPDRSIKKDRACNEAKSKNKKARGAERRRTSGG